MNQYDIVYIDLFLLQPPSRFSDKIPVAAVYMYNA